MSIDVGAIRAKFTSVAQDAVGAQLSSTGPPTALEPSVIRARSKGTNPAYPFITLDILDIRDEDGWITEREVNEADHLEYFTHKKVSLYYRSFGPNSISIINDLQSYFRLEGVRDSIRSVLSGSVVNTMIIDSVPMQLVDEYIESSSLGITFNIVDTYEDTTTGIIDNVDISGEIYRHADDSTPFTTNTIVP